MNAEDAKENGLTGPLRVTFVYDLVNATKEQLPDVGMCSETGTFKPKYCGKSSCPDIDCTKEEHLITKNKVEIAQSRLNWVKDYLNKTFQVRRVQDKIVIDKQVLRQQYFDGNNELPPFLNLEYSNTDLVILMSMVSPPSPRTHTLSLTHIELIANLPAMGSLLQNHLPNHLPVILVVGSAEHGQCGRLGIMLANGSMGPLHSRSF